MVIKDKAVCTRSFKEDSQIWTVTLADDGEFIFRRKVPYMEKVDPFWRCWNYGKEIEDEYTIYANPDIKLPAIRVIRNLAVTMIEIVKMHHLTFFYFAANSEKKSRVYKTLIDRYIDKIPGDWIIQHIDHHFYITKITK